MTEPVKYMDIAEFQTAGFLQEANRLFFHPLGLALEVDHAADGTVSLSGVWDYRDDPEGMLYSPSPDDQIAIEWAKAQTVEAERLRHVEARRAVLDGATVQPVTEEHGISIRLIWISES